MKTSHQSSISVGSKFSGKIERKDGIVKVTTTNNDITTFWTATESEYNKLLERAKNRRPVWMTNLIEGSKV